MSQQSKADFSKGLLDRMGDLSSAQPVTRQRNPTALSMHINTQEVERLRTQVKELQLLAQSGGDAGILLDPKQVKQSRWANRHELSYQTEDFKQLKTMISHTKGNVQPIGVMKNENGEWVLVFGHRRLRACRDLGLMVRAVALAGEYSEDLLLLAMRHENEGQLSPSVWEQGHWFKSMLDSGKYKSQRELAETFGMSHTWVGVALEAASIPAEIVNCWPNPVEIPTPAFKALKKAMESDAESVLLRASVIRDRVEPLPAGEVLKHLLHDDGEGPEEKPRKLALAPGKRSYGTVRKDGQSRTVLVLDPVFRRDDIQRLLKLAEEMAKAKPALTEDKAKKAGKGAKAKPAGKAKDQAAGAEKK